MLFRHEDDQNCGSLMKCDGFSLVLKSNSDCAVLKFSSHGLAMLPE
jgi:hypothetical protein